MAARTESTAPEYARFIAGQRRAGRFTDPPQPLDPGSVADRVLVDPDSASRLLRTAALRAAGLFRPTRRSQVVWVDGARELAIAVSDLRLELGDGVVVLWIPVRCDQLGTGLVSVAFAVGAPGRPAGLYAATERRPRGPQVVLDSWGDALVAFGWQCLLGLVTGLAGAAGKDDRGNLLVPVELEASPDGLTVVPMARHRFSGSSGLAGRAAGDRSRG